MANAVRLHDEKAAVCSLEKLVWREGPVCPHCGETCRLGRLSGQSTPIGAWKCYACRKPFTVRHGTIFQNSHVPMHVWLQGLYLLVASKHRVSSQKLGQVLGVSVRTAWHLKTKIAAGLAAAEDYEEPQGAVRLLERVVREPIADDPAPLQPGQAVCKSRYERFLKAIENLADASSDALFLDALHQLLLPSSELERSSGILASGRGIEQQLELSLFDDGKRQMGGSRSPPREDGET
ncbi:transposase [Bosea sp. BH3]|uniref:transposase n=1 Tax=Bosea sp. BH3 TaxID=2871701 RepID=UPI0021CB2075|nr:transposase [Bosea sp. BH3]MCU4181189.1 transposase [Bosea sp. BH3]